MTVSETTPAGEETDSRFDRRPDLWFYPTSEQLQSIVTLTAQLIHLAELYLEVVGEPGPGPQPPPHLKDIGLPFVDATAQRLEQVLSGCTQTDESPSMEQTLVLGWLAETFYGLM